ncbi:MAG: cytochrome P450 [Pseudomonadota bacterium]
MPVLDLTAHGFSTRSPDVLAAREAHWCARTPYGLAVLRHAQTGRLLRDRRLRQGSHAWPGLQGLRGPFVDFWQRSVIGQEGPRHKALRHLAVPALAAEHIEALVPSFDETAAELCGTLGKDTEFMEAFAMPFAGRAITALLGMEAAAWPEIAANAVSLGLAMGVDAAAHAEEINTAYLALEALAEARLDRARQGRDAKAYPARLVARADGLDEQALRDLVVITIFGGVDTTRAQLGLAMALFAQHPEQWSLLRTRPELVPAAVEEAIRMRPTTTWVTREALESFTFEGVAIRQGEILHMLVHASARDPAICAGGFDIAARRRAHFGFGGGAHHCLGQGMARADIASALRALSARFASVEPTGEPLWLPESGNTGPVRLPLSFA